MRRTSLTAISLLLASLCFWQALPTPPSVATATPATLATSHSQSSRPQLKAAAIQDPRVGMQVLAQNPELAGVSVPQSHISPATWRVVTLRMPGPDRDTFDIQLLRPLSWLEKTHAEVGRQIPLAIPEQGLDGPADVLSIGPCPAFQQSTQANQHTITGTFTHHRRVFDVWLSGSKQPIGTTDNHPFWSQDRLAFVRADALQTGERLKTAGGESVRVSRTGYRGTIQRVYNLEIDTQHVFYVGPHGTLVHNDCTYDTSAPHVDHILARAFGGTDDTDNLRVVTAGLNLRKGGLESELKKYENYLIKTGMDPTDARSVIQGELDALGRDALPTPVSRLRNHQ